MTRAAENTIWFAPCNCCHIPYQNCRSLVVVPAGRIQAQTQLLREKLLTSDIDIEQATQAMFRFDLETCAPVLFGDQIQLEEFTKAIEEKEAL